MASSEGVRSRATEPLCSWVPIRGERTAAMYSLIGLCKFADELPYPSLEEGTATGSLERPFPTCSGCGAIDSHAQFSALLLLLQERLQFLNVFLHALGDHSVRLGLRVVCGLCQFLHVRERLVQGLLDQFGHVRSLWAA
jgi:hypothetical protein